MISEHPQEVRLSPGSQIGLYEYGEGLSGYMQSEDGMVGLSKVGM